MKNLQIYENGVNVEFVRKSFIDKLNKIVNNFNFYGNEVTQFNIGLIFNKKFQHYKKEYENKDKFYSIFHFNLPDMNGKQYNEIMRILTEIKKLFAEQNRIELEEAGVDSVSIMFLYNKPFSKINIKGLKMDNTKKNNSKNLIFIPTIPKYKLEQVVLNEELKKEIDKALLILKHRELIYDTWGYGEIEPSPKAILNFYGPSGTGKTMTAQAIADHLKMKIMALNYADIESKFVGDAPKNLVKAFEIATQEKALLFFDEADSFLGKRITNISSSSDQAVNSLRSQLLILLENFEGIVIFATNLMKNYDKAFESRIFKHLKFDLPDITNRKLIIQKSIPNKIPFENGIGLNEKYFMELAEISDGLSGRHIKNAILNALTNAILDERQYLCISDFRESFSQLSANLKNIKESNNSTGLSDKRKRELETKISKKLKRKSSWR